MSIGSRIFVALLAASLGVLLLSTLATRWNFQRGFLDYVAEQETERLTQLADELALVYERDGSWDTLRRDPQAWMQLQRPERRGLRPPRPGEPPPGGPGGKPPPHDPLGLGPRLVLIDAAGGLVVGKRPPDTQGLSVAVDVEGETVGMIWLARPRHLENRIDQEFADKQDRTIYMVAAVALLIAALVSAILARQLSRPIRDLSKTTKTLARGGFDIRIETARRDELGQLAHDFNELARSLQKNRESRRRWVTDIAHELRTPISIMHGELEAITDGIRKFSPSTIESLRAEIDRLLRLVGDLHELSESDEGGLDYCRQTLDLATLVTDLATGVESRVQDAGLLLRVDAGSEPVPVVGDPGRLEQLLSNLLENSIRYTDSPGTIDVRVSRSPDEALLVVSDSAPGVPDESLPYLFDRLYRVDPSRSRETGGSGLGLSICKAIVEAHDGTIAAEHSDVGGLRIAVHLPLRSAEDAPA